MVCLKQQAAMKKSVVEETLFYADELLGRERASFHDTKEAVTDRVARKTGLSAIHINRIRYRWRDMSDVSGAAYRALRKEYEVAVAEEQRRATILRATQGEGR